MWLLNGIIPYLGVAFFIILFSENYDEKGRHLRNLGILIILLVLITGIAS